MSGTIEPRPGMDSPERAQDGMDRPEHGRTRTHPTFRRAEIVAINLS